MARAARSAGRQAAVTGLLAGVAACATVQDPPGGPPDFEPPIIVAIVPDSGSVQSGFDDALEFRFDEVINEVSAGGLENLIEVSPRHEEVSVNWRRSRITVRPRDGWRDSVTYTVRLQPGVTDLRNNRLDSTQTVVFSTGGQIPTTLITGSVVDWELGQLGVRSLVEVIRPADSLVFWTLADSVGGFEFNTVPPGTYALLATVDQNNDGLRDRRESFDSTTIRLDSSVTEVLWTFPHDTVGPRLRNVTTLDSLSIAVEFTQPLDTVDVDVQAVTVRSLPDSTPVSVEAVQWRAIFDSVQTVIRDSLAAITQDSIAAADSLAPDTAAVTDTMAIAQPLPDEIAAIEPDSVDVEQARILNLLAQRPPLQNIIVIVMTEPLTPGERYVVEVTVRNLLGIAEASARAVLAPELPDSIPGPPR